MPEILAGCCGWPEARERYFRDFPVVEIQDTFYQPPAPALAEKWRAAAPPDFHFCLKAWQLITHTPASPTYRRLKTPVAAEQRDAFGSFRDTPEVRGAWERTLEIARRLRAAAIVFQCPASFQPTAENRRNVESFFARAEREDRLFAWEPRGDWPPELVRDLCAELDLTHCVDPFQASPVYGETLYFRLHGRGGYRYRYTDEEIAHVLALVLDYRARGHSVYVMFNNSYMKDDALRLMARLNRVHG